MKKTAIILALFAMLAWAGDKTSSDSLILKPTAEQLANAKPLGNTICPVTQAKIGSMGKPVQVIYKGQIVNLCCLGCPSDFAKNPEKFMKVLEKEHNKSTPTNQKTGGHDHH